MIILIDQNAGPCKGVKRALAMIEEELRRDQNIVALGPIIHNQVEMERLEMKGLVTVDQEKVEKGTFESIKDRRVFIRSHGIAKKLQQRLIEAGAELCDGTCPTVRTIQRQIERCYRDGYQIFIVGRPTHPEVIGLNGYCDNQAIVIQSEADLDRIKVADKAVLVSQTTVAHDKFLAIQKKMLQISPSIIVKDTVCRQVTRRHENIRNFAANVDVVLLVGGKKSSNTRVLFDIAKQSNPHAYWIEQQNDIDATWFDESCRIGITGSASTPMWQLEKIQKYVESITIH